MGVGRNQPREMSVVVPLIASTVVGLLASQLDRKTLERYDIFNTYITFSREYNNAIDLLLMNPNHGLVSSTIYLSSTLSIPGEGTHYLYAPKETWIDYLLGLFRYVVFQKTKETINNREVYTYRALIRCWSALAGIRTPGLYLEQQDAGMIQTMHLDVASYEPAIVFKTKTYSLPHANQQTIAAHILHSLQMSPFNNVKYLLSGPKGKGKSYTASVVKKALDATGKSCFLFDDFNPATRGLDVTSVVLSRASASSPVILVIDEFDVAVDEVLVDKTGMMDTRFSHTQNKATFNAMLDAIDRTANLIAIFTTEKPPSHFKSHDDRACYVRAGRVNWFVEIDDLVTFTAA